MHTYANPTATASDSAANPYMQSPATPAAVPYRTSPILAFLLGWIPGVGAIYNGQYLKGLVHALVFGLLVTAISKSAGDGEPLMGMVVMAFSFYMPFEAYHTAKKRQMGVPVDELSSIVSLNSYANRFPLWPMILIMLGVVFLLDSLNIIRFSSISRFWPLLLILVGANMLFGRMSAASQQPPVYPPPPNYPSTGYSSPYPPTQPPVTGIVEAHRER